MKAVKCIWFWSFIYSAHIYNMERKSSTQHLRFIKSTYQLKMSECLVDTKFENFHHQMGVNLLYNATETVRIFKNEGNFAFFEKIIDFFSRKNMNFFKIGEGGKFAVESVSKKKISQNCIFHFNCEVVFCN